MKIPFVKSGVVGYLDDIPYGFCSDSTERDANFADQPVGFIAITYGFGTMWQKKPDGTWADME